MKMATPPHPQTRRTTEYCCTAWYCQGPPGTPIRFAGGHGPSSGPHAGHQPSTPNTTTPGLSFSGVAVPKNTGWQHVRQETGDRCCAIRRTHIAHDEEDGRGRCGTMLNIEHADEDKDKCSTHAIFIADLREPKPQGEREALEKDTVGMCQPAQRKRSVRQTNDQEVATAASTRQDRKIIASA